MGSGMAAAPVIAGLAAGIAFVMAFSLYSVPRDSRTPLNKNEHIVMEIGNLKDTYRINKPISFSIYVKGVSANLCNDPKATAVIVSPKNRRPVWSTPFHPSNYNGLRQRPRN